MQNLIEITADNLLFENILYSQIKCQHYIQYSVGIQELHLKIKKNIQIGFFEINFFLIWVNRLILSILLILE